VSSKLRRYLLDAYAGTREVLPEKIRKDFPIQIDDQDDDDPVSDFCNIFVIVKKNNCFEIELFGNPPISHEIEDLAEIYGGFANEQSKRIVMTLSTQQIEALIDLAKRIRNTVAGQVTAGPATWHNASARTISSLYRFVRIIKEYSRSSTSSL
jgi:hypothetical protein